MLVTAHLSRGCGKKLFRCLTVLREAAHAQANAKLNNLPGAYRKFLGCDSTSDAFAHHGGHNARSHRHNGNKFVAGVACQYVHLSQFFSDYTSDTGKHAIPNSVSIFLIDCFEI